MVMNNELNQYERVQNYLCGRMSDEDKAAFERDLAKDDSLRKEYDDLSLLARSIIIANKEADLRMALDDYESHICTNFRDSEDNLDEELAQVERELSMINDKGRIIDIRGGVAAASVPAAASMNPGRHHSYASRIAISFAVAASLLLGIVLPYNAKKASSGFNYAPSHIELPTFRGGASDKIEAAVKAYNSGKYGEALAYLEEVQNDIESGLGQLGDEDSDVIAIQGLTEELYQVEWYRAIALMKDKKVKKAKRVLRAISGSNSPYAKEALDILSNVY